MSPAPAPKRLAGAALSLLALAAGGAQAQTAPRLASPGRADQNPPGARTPPPVPALRQRNANAPIRPFPLASVAVEGSSLDPGVLKRVYAPLVGATMDNAALRRLTDAVAAAYGRSDIALYSVFVPEQTFGGGVLRLVVVEGYVEAVQVDGGLSGPQRRLLARYLEPITRERPLRTSTLQRRLSLIRDMPGLTVAPQFQRGGREGAARLVLKVRARPVQVALGVSDRGTALLGRDQIEMDGFLNGALAGADQLRLTVVVPSDPGLFQYAALAYSLPLNAEGTTLSATGSYLRTRPASLPLQGHAGSGGIALSHPVVRSFNRNLYLTASLDGADSHNALLGFTLSKDRTRAARLAASYSRSGARNLFTASATASLGVDGLGARVFDRSVSQPDFRKLNLKASDILQVAPGLYLRLNSFAQVSGSLLPASEQIALGGDEFGRAYEAALVAGDQGVAASAELAWRPAAWTPRPLSGSELYTFIDGGRVFSHGRAGSEAADARLASVGGGLRIQIADRTVVGVEAVRGLYNPVFYENREVWRALLNVRSLF